MYRELETQHFNRQARNNFGEVSYEARQIVKHALLEALDGDWWMGQ